MVTNIKRILSSKTASGKGQIAAAPTTQVWKYHTAVSEVAYCSIDGPQHRRPCLTMA